MKLVRATLAGWLLACGIAHSQGVTVISHPSVDLPPDEVRDLFIGDRQFAGELKLVPIDNLSAQRGFLAVVLRIDPARYSTLWAKRSFRDGIAPPETKASDAEVIDFVRRTPGAIGYVGAGATLREVRVIAGR